MGEIGDNPASRSEITFSRYPEPPVCPEEALATHEIAGTEGLRFVYPGDARHDAETLPVAPSSGAPFIISKELNTRARTFRSPAPQLPGPIRTLETWAALRRAGRSRAATSAPRRPDRAAQLSSGAALAAPNKPKALPRPSRPPPRSRIRIEQVPHPSRAWGAFFFIQARGAVGHRGHTEPLVELNRFVFGHDPTRAPLSMGPSLS